MKNLNFNSQSRNVFNNKSNNHSIGGESRKEMLSSLKEYQHNHGSFYNGSVGKAFENAILLVNTYEVDPDEKAIKALNETFNEINDLLYKNDLMSHYKAQKIETLAHRRNCKEKNYNFLSIVSSYLPVYVRTVTSYALSYENSLKQKYLASDSISENQVLASSSDNTTLDLNSEIIMRKNDSLQAFKVNEDIDGNNFSKQVKQVAKEETKKTLEKNTVSNFESFLNKSNTKNSMDRLL